MTTPVEEIRIHRFRDNVAFHTDGTPTIYMTAAMAKKFATMLRRYANDVEKVKFVSSPLNAITFKEK